MVCDENGEKKKRVKEKKSNESSYDIHIGVMSLMTRYIFEDHDRF